jgi:hypothetical protein
LNCEATIILPIVSHGCEIQYLAVKKGNGWGVFNNIQLRREAYYSTLKMEATCSSETSVDF